MNSPSESTSICQKIVATLEHYFNTCARCECAERQNGRSKCHRAVRLIRSPASFMFLLLLPSPLPLLSLFASIATAERALRNERQTTS